MEKRTREILALVLLAVLGLAVAAGMAWYVIAGHGWNQAASRIDDMVGSMEGYTVVVCEGTASKPRSAARDAAKPARLSRVAKSYRDKGAAVIELPASAASLVDEPSILLRNGKRFGVLESLGKYPRDYPKFRAQIRYLKRHAVDCIVAVSREKGIMKGKLDGVNLLVVMRDAGLPEAGEVRAGALCVDSPYKGEVQAVIIAPSGVMTSRTVRGS